MSTPARLFNKNFVLLWQGQFVSRLGSQAHMVAMMFWVKHATGSATLMGTIMMISMLPLVILSPFGGTFADLHSRRRIIITCDVVYGVSVLTIAALMFTVPGSVTLITGWIMVVAAVSGIVSAFFHPAITAAIPSIVPEERVAAANSINEGSFQVSTLIGQGVGGVLFRVLGAPLLFLIDALTFLYSAASEFFMKIPQEIPERKASWRVEFTTFGSETVEGLRYVWRRKGMRNLFVASAFLNFFAVPFVVLLPFYVEDVLNRQPDWFGFLMAGYGAGGLAGYALYGTLGMSDPTRSRVLNAALVLLSACLVGIGFSRSAFVSLGLVVAAGLFGGLYNVAAMTLIQLSTPERMRGRVFGLLHTLVLGLSPFAMALAGIVADVIDRDVSVLFIVCGIVLVVISAGVGANRDYRRFLAYESNPSDPTAET